MSEFLFVFLGSEVVLAVSIIIGLRLRSQRSQRNYGRVALFLAAGTALAAALAAVALSAPPLLFAAVIVSIGLGGLYLAWRARRDGRREDLQSVVVLLVLVLISLLLVLPDLLRL